MIRLAFGHSERLTIQPLLNRLLGGISSSVVLVRLEEDLHSVVLNVSQCDHLIRVLLVVLFALLFLFGEQNRLANDEQ